jgi:class 3 adenylate cyclase
MAAAPTGTVTFLFTDIEGSTQLWERSPDAMRSALARHDDIVRRAIDAHDGYVFSTGGDGFAAAFHRTTSAVEAAAVAQRALEAQAWPDDIRLRIRIGIHIGECTERDGDYFGSAVNRAARLMGIAHGG